MVYLPGFGQAGLKTFGRYTFMEQLIVDGLVSKPLFSMYLTDDGERVTSDTLAGGSQMCLGCILTPPISTTGPLYVVQVTDVRAREKLT
jgi:hypothetical protein